MPTKFILVGGYPKSAPDGGKSFCEEVIRNFKTPVKILECLFARPEENWNKAFNEDKNFFSKNLPKIKLDFKLADKENFLDQVNWADAVYIRGGDSERLLANILSKKGFKNGIRNKTIAGSSAGADALVKYFYNLDSLKIEKGLGLLPIRLIVHFLSNYNAPNINWGEAYKELDAYKETSPILTLREGEFKIFKI